MNKRIQELENLVLKAKQSYYIGDCPIMSDEAFDALEDELRDLNPESEVLALVGAPVPADSILQKAEHSIPMGSQNKVNSAEEFASYAGKMKLPEFYASLKADGASAAAYYKDSILIQAISRGDGEVGEDITANAVKFQNLPARVYRPNGTPFSGAVRFEVVLTVENWKKLDPGQLKNPRNLGNGIMGRKNGKDSELLSAYVFDVFDYDNQHIFSTEVEKVIAAELLGFKTIPGTVCLSVADCEEYFDLVEDQRSKLPFWIDGVVFKMNDLHRQEVQGVSSGKPKGQIARKFKAPDAETVITGYEISGGHTGALIPVAKFTPVEIGGTTVQSASLANFEEVKRLGLRVGDVVRVVKANDIIPKIISVIAVSEGEEIQEPKRCPFCGGHTSRQLGHDGSPGAITICENKDCPKKGFGKMARWIKSLDIQGVGDSVLEALVSQLGVSTPGELYGLHMDERRLTDVKLGEKGIRLGEKRAEKITQELEKKRELSIVQFMGSLGVRGLGVRKVQLMIDAMPGELEEISDWQGPKLRGPDFAAAAGVPNTGLRISNSIAELAPTINGLLDNGVRIVRKLHVGECTKSVRKIIIGTVAITGKLPSGKKKKDYAQALDDAGYKLVDKVDHELSYLVLADPGSESAKAKKARKLGVELIDEERLLELVSK